MSASLGGAKTAAGVQTAPTRGRYTNGLEGKQCYQCGEFGHLMLSCPRRPRPAQMGWSGTANGERRKQDMPSIPTIQVLKVYPGGTVRQRRHDRISSSTIPASFHCWISSRRLLDTAGLAISVSILPPTPENYQNYVHAHVQAHTLIIIHVRILHAKP